tara:strand:- start:6 stop:668 length:663 start_codon:yes stop_codon:yes gene_type:complete
MAIIKFQTNLPQSIRFPFGDFKEKEGNYGIQYQYACQPAGAGMEDDLDVLFATKTLHEMLIDAGLTRGSIFTICKIEKDGRSSWTIEGGIDGGAAVEQIATENAPPQAPPVNGAPVMPLTPSRLPGKPSLYQLSSLMGHCLSESHRLWADMSVEHDAGHIQASANTLFIQASKERLWEQVTESAVIPDVVSAPAELVAVPTTPTPGNLSADQDLPFSPII